MADLARIPHDLRRFVVEQDYAQYTEVDQAVWRFVLLQTYQRLQFTAHPAYREGLGRTGISVERIPRIDEMSACLQAFGWSAVCVDGFIPPRAFQAFQAASILPIAADMRSQDHLVYTPAPDIIHEAAGHAPILSDARYAAYLRAIGEVGKKAFSSPQDARVDAAIRELSEVKEQRDVSAEAVARVEARLAEALAAVTGTSEASRLSRLYWWTSEYGLVGTPQDYRLYGAGLLSSLWESHSCHDPSVLKLPLSARCTERSYDITKPQPQLYVARDFEQLFSVLGEVEASLAHRIGGQAALDAASRSEEVATLHFADGHFVTGILRAASEGRAPRWLGFRGRVGFGADGELSHSFDSGPHGYRLPLGPLVDERCLEHGGGRVTLRYASGITLSGTLAEASRDAQGRWLGARVVDYELRSLADGFLESGDEYRVLFASSFVTAHAGASDARYFPASEPSLARVPLPRTLLARERALLDLYERAVTAFRSQLGAEAVHAFAAIHRDLGLAFPDEWLLRWNLLECLCKLGGAEPLSSTLQSELWALERRFAEREPIASGLRYLAALAA